MCVKALYKVGGENPRIKPSGILRDHIAVDQSPVYPLKKTRDGIRSVSVSMEHRLSLSTYHPLPSPLSHNPSPLPHISQNTRECTGHQWEEKTKPTQGRRGHSPPSGRRGHSPPVGREDTAHQWEERTQPTSGRRRQSPPSGRRGHSPPVGGGGHSPPSGRRGHSPPVEERTQPTSRRRGHSPPVGGEDTAHPVGGEDTAHPVGGEDTGHPVGRHLCRLVI